MFTNKMICQIDEYMLYCQSKQLSEKTMESYEQTLHLFERWCEEEMLIENVTEITEGVIRRYINDLQTRGKYMVCCNDGTKKMNCPEPVSYTHLDVYKRQVPYGEHFIVPPLVQACGDQAQPCFTQKSRPRRA